MVLCTQALQVAQFFGALGKLTLDATEGYGVMQENIILQWLLS